MALPKLIHLKAAPRKEVAEKMAKKPFLLIEDVSALVGLDATMCLRLIRQYGVKPFQLETTHFRKVEGYDTLKIKSMLARRGRIVPGFNEELATTRQWAEVLESSVKEPLKAEWYFPPVYPDPLVDISEESSTKILTHIEKALSYEGDASEILRLVADIINTETNNFEFVPREELALPPGEVGPKREKLQAKRKRANRKLRKAKKAKDNSNE